MTDLHQFPSLEAFGRQLDTLAERDARGGAPRSTRARRARRAPALRFAALAAMVAAIAGGTYAVPATRAAVDDVYGVFSGWFSGDEGAAPGRGIEPGEQVPAWVAAEDGEKRVLAEAGGEKLVAIRNGDKLTLALAGFGESATIADYRKELSGHRVRLVGPGRFVPDGRHDRRPLFGLASASVKSIRFTYADGTPPVVEDNLEGAFGIVIAADRHPQALTGYDASGAPVARIDLTTPGMNDFRYCPARGCLPWHK